MELKNERDTGKKGDERKRQDFARKAVLAGSLAIGVAAAGCLTVNNIPYEPTPDGGGAGERCMTDCQESSAILREEGNSAGTNSVSVGNAVLRFKGLVDEGSTKAATLELEGCGSKVSDNLAPGETTTLTLNSESVDVSVEAMEYDGAGLKLTVMIVPCVGLSDGDGGSGGSGGDGGAGGSG